MMSKRNALLCGPWIGEFSYEILGWSAKLRYYINNHYSDYYIIHFGFPGREALYRDFVDEYISYDKSIIDNMIPANSGGVGRGSEHTLTYKPTEDFTSNWISENKDKYGEMYCLRPEDLNCITKSQVIVNMPDTEFIHLKSKDSIENEVITFLKDFGGDRNVISVMAPTPHEIFEYKENWNPDSWLFFLDNAINELDLNVVMMGIKAKDNLQGSYTFEDSYLYDKYPNRITSYVLNSDLEGALDYQIAVIRNTACSVWGSTGASQIAYYCGKPVFAQLVYGTLDRVSLDSQKEITNNFKDIKYLHKYNSGFELYDSPADEFYREFKQFYNEKIGE